MMKSRSVQCVCAFLLLLGRGLPSSAEYNASEETSDSVSSSYNNPILNFLYDPGLSVKEIRDMEDQQWHWYPWRRIQYKVAADGNVLETECVDSSSFEEMPEDLFTQEQRKNGAVILHFLAAMYFFTVLAVVCDNYFLPSVELICEDLNISQDVAAATFMSVASTTPELFTNMIGTFVANTTDMGLGTIIGSMMFNTLGVAACASLAAKKPVKLDWFPLTRDSIIFTINLCILVGMAWDGEIQWYETSILFALFITYFLVLFKNHRWEKYIRNFVEKRCSFCRPSASDLEENSEKKGECQKEAATKAEIESTTESIGTPSEYSSLFSVPETTKLKRIWWFYTWPIRFVLMVIVPNPVTKRRWYPLTFVLCIALIGLNSYMVYWMVSTIGHTLDVPESVMGLTLLACGGCLPEAISCVILIRRGEGSFGVSNSLGANSLAILMSLGVPWFVKTMVAGAASTNAHIAIQSYGIVFTITSLLLAVLALYVVMTIANYRLRRTVGFCLIFVYVILISVAILNELDIVFPSGNNC